MDAKLHRPPRTTWGPFQATLQIIRETGLPAEVTQRSIRRRPEGVSDLSGAAAREQFDALRCFGFIDGDGRPNQALADFASADDDVEAWSGFREAVLAASCYRPLAKFASAPAPDEEISDVLGEAYGLQGSDLRATTRFFRAIAAIGSSASFGSAERPGRPKAATTHAQDGEAKPAIPIPGPSDAIRPLARSHYDMLVHEIYDVTRMAKDSEEEKAVTVLMRYLLLRDAEK